ncbi:hypothetical protein [Chroococcus sp. FPU101]|uniref:hypothetical protein n=1 Tax=Chroococcus sp. FPU101 TaxID=1974212 RepID=UPI001A8E4231|nr:hypothetical protein [Chroococcus sp. FPU101]GFE71405.1 hypothetical protein CFPU101_40150 [Chroococcus sp. FPU101]
MRFHSLSMLMGIAALGAGLFPVSLTAAPVSNPTIVAQNVPVGTVGQVSPNQTIRVVVQNNTPVALFAGISGGTRVELPRGASTAFTFDSTPINVFVYPDGQAISLKYDTSIQGNTVTVRVTQVGGETPGDGSVNINRSGAVYVF